MCSNHIRSVHEAWRNLFNEVFYVMLVFSEINKLIKFPLLPSDAPRFGFLE